MEDKNSKKSKMPFFIYLALTVIVLLVFNYSKELYINKEITYDEFMTMLDKKEVDKVQVSNDTITIIPKDNSEYADKTLYTANMDDYKLVDKLSKAGVTYAGKNQKESVILDFVVAWVLPLILF